MGCAASVKKGAGKPQPPAKAPGPGDPVPSGVVAILIRGATGLPDADLLSWPDCYCVCRVGPAGSRFADKDKATERRSHTILNSDDPVWNFGIMYQRSVFDGGAELHVRVKDQDLLSADDALGDLRVTLESLEAGSGMLTEYLLLGCEGENAGKLAGRLTMMTGDKVWAAITAHASKLPQSREPISAFQQFGMAIYQYVHHAEEVKEYYATMLKFLVAGQSSATGLRKWFLERSSKKNAQGALEDTYVWDGPSPSNCVTYSGHGEVTARLEALGQQLGTTNADGAVYRNNALGFQLFPHGLMWPELDPHATIGLGQTQENHALARPLFWKTVGPEGQGRWTQAQVRSWAEAFWEGRQTCDVGRDLEVWVTQVLHRVHLDIELDESEGGKFMDMQFKILIGTTLPEVLFPILGIDKAVEDKLQRLEKYKEALARLWPEEWAAMDAKQHTLLASNFMDSLCFAGGASVPSVLRWCLGLLWAKWGQENLPADFVLSSSSLRRYVMETIRRFPPVGGFGYVERAFGGQPDKQVFCNLGMAQRDPRVWGPDSDAFRPRPIAEYEKSVGWAEPAVCPHGGSANSHVCPAKDLSIVMVCEFLGAFLRATNGADAPEDQALDKDRWECDTPPENLKITEYSTSSFKLTRK